ncbi:unnamed protein product [Effrenium voratum]|uniref:EF-hand domain-containing protein n=1 Tax=Effrenium voratum TaxID=2562239 RepID=A0AA36IFR7_9DINO|nr:unnamed protein product [Effrenium voratum]CAJ1385943.1 unnamed protein product [Effrenium voratum]CAJ1453561.1 unnamed protein product [Effrenium voratum]|mmetsp:Transcript_4153/g.10018  ORF Transcript_4153/g.10018 Transcript_4153/m.10018 type:complete len:518 (+) Transcript_4153:46-1599(+)|eukprot:CAMPEP_0181448196 /NCGR_PEP_ID=MMETSP1110-20121109/27015_1 /TAXON_ID=174948 /ORGANISM="Symbiodinium sp., Strain CCMP421" /LENGTH=517 /DNA_ID=CAMNT_0023572337 /DNA_START=46 /DNA_END=1599 /DNA_ORIENTATION=+
MQRSGSGRLAAGPSGTKAKFRTRQQSTHSDLEDQTGGASRFQIALDFVITGDFSGLYRSVKHGIIDAVVRFRERRDNFLKWLHAQRKEQEQRAMDMTLEHPYPKIRYIVNSNQFEIVGNFVIFCNTFVVGWQAEKTPRNTTDQDKLLSVIFENFFTFAFVVELTLSTMCWGWTSLVKRENWMDVFLVFLGVLTTWILGPFGIEVEFLRKLTALRTMRLIRLARAVRLRPEFKEMWALMKGLTESGETLFWTYVMIACVLYFFAIIATSLIGKAEAFADSELAQEFFGDVLRSMLTLFQLMTLDSWTGFARPLMEIQVWTGAFFIFFISVAVFVMLNLVTAVIVENAFSDSKSEEKELAVRLEREKEEELEDLKQFFLQIDLDGSGSLTKQEFFKATKQRKIRQKLRALDIMPKDIDELWDILDEGKGELAVEDFQNGIRRLRGEAKAKDILRLYKEVRQFETSVEEVEGHIESSKRRLRNIQEQLSRCRTDVAAFTRTLVRAKEAVKMAAQTQNMSS